VAIVLGAVEDSSPLIDKLKEARKRAGSVVGVSGGEEEVKEKEKDVEARRAQYKQACRVHAEAFEALTALQQSNVPWYMLAERLKAGVRDVQARYCPHINRYFASAEQMRLTRREEFGFAPATEVDFGAPAPVPVSGLTMVQMQAQRQAAGAGVQTQAQTVALWARLDASLSTLLPALMPREDFHPIR
jgi:hypothetical protein